MPIAPSSQPRLVALIGGSGFIGTALTEAFAALGWRVLAVCRNPENARHLKPLGDLGQIGARAGDVRDEAGLRTALSGADAVVNLVGILEEKGGQRFADIHVRGAANAANAALAAGARAFVQLSAIGASPQSPSAYYRTKAEGEAAVRAVLPDAAIVRPSLVFGAGDSFTNRFASLIAAAPAVPVIAPETRFQPVYVNDVAAAIVAIVERQFIGNAGKLWELGGPEILRMRDLVAFIAEATGQEKPLVDTPDFGARLLSSFGFLPGAPLTQDQYLMLKADNILSGQYPGLGDLGIPGTPLAAVAGQWLGRYRTGGRFAVA
ncbi:complex I NDUFA9 subunit family protein [Sandaracinobacter sp. RS1-74]|uniref:complex I NDUFA9 subunit family protein n=1 Tax=Sandaracinobacteroides sayramensis TaxID=2913411 RepID=UPI001EDB3B9E|nr:complex I NDUFA9 subunit family protein [Sandaracinobacteroides sayramensis]MCG2841833.1 complex I NDUFA9 subunit family protein [Sandaracinobacteroides sayramensis]